MYSRNKMFVALFGALAILIVIIGGCRTLTWRDFRPAESQSPVTFFDRYVMHMEGTASIWHNMFVSFDFIQPIWDTTNIDDLPIFVVDSLTFCGNCIAAPFSVVPQSWSQMKTNHELGGNIWYDGIDLANKPSRYDDLYIINRKVVPAGFTLLSAYKLPSNCTDSSVFVNFHARLIDRKSGKEMDKETKNVRFMIRNKRRILFMS